MKRIYTAANFNQDDDLNSLVYQEQLLSQFWLPEEIALSPDLQLWNTLPKDIRQAYVENLQVLTLLDTIQGQASVNVVGTSLAPEDHLKRAVYNTMAMFEDNIHAKSYSTIYQTYITPQEINEIFEWSDNNKNLQTLIKIIADQYEALEKETFCRKYAEPTVGDLAYMKLQWKAAAAAVLLETYLFYSGFYYPLWFGGQGKLRGAAEIISLIVR